MSMDENKYVQNPPEMVKTTPTVRISRNRYSFRNKRRIFIMDKKSPKVIKIKGRDNRASKGFISPFSIPMTAPTAKNPHMGSIKKESFPNKTCTKKRVKAFKRMLSMIRFPICKRKKRRIKKILRRFFQKCIVSCSNSYISYRNTSVFFYKRYILFRVFW